MSYDCTLSSMLVMSARRTHTCSWCGELIAKGENYHRYVGIHEGVFQSHGMHPECRDAARTLNSDDGFDAYSYQRGKVEPR